MTDITSPRLLYVKGALFLLCGLMAAVLLLLESPTLKTAVLLGLSVWCLARAYYFAFYVIEHYVDPSYRFAGLGSFVKYSWTRWRRTGSQSVPERRSRPGRSRSCDES